MSHSPDYSSTLSIKLSEVLEDIGVNEEMIMRRRRALMLMENICTVSRTSIGKSLTCYYLGSQSEGTTTIGLDSDTDILRVFHDFNVVQDLSEWKQNKINYLIIQDENVTPGYCFLQLLRSDQPLPATHIPDEYHLSDSNGRILFKPLYFIGVREDAERQGPSNAVSGYDGYTDVDIVFAIPCNSLPRSASNFLDREGIGKWPSSEMIRYAATNGCFIVGASSKTSTHPDLEWRISTSLAERCLMFNLNITQICCYVLMKMILTTSLNPRKENGLSSFMCKTVLLHCVKNTDKGVWMKSNLSTCLRHCLIELHSCLKNDKCQHVMIPENNLMAGQFTVEVKRDLLKRIRDIIQSDDRYLLRINIDDLGHRLQVKLNKPPYIVLNFPTPCEIHETWLSALYISLAECINQGPSKSSQNINFKNILKQQIYNLTNYNVNGNRLEQLASRYEVPFLCSTLGSILASSCIGRNNPVSPQALSFLSLGLNSDVTSGRLKLATVYYCTCDMYRAEFILRQTKGQYDSNTVVPICGCWSHPVMSRIPAEFKRKCHEQSENCIRHTTSFCIRFLMTEWNCVPRELQYEMYRSTQDEMTCRSTDEIRWMDYIVIDSPSHLYFLQYKTYGYLQRYQDQQHALNNLSMSIVRGDGFGHKETALNLLGKCMEQENKPREALQCYMLSLRQRARNNAAKIHICCLLAKIVRQM